MEHFEDLICANIGSSYTHKVRLNCHLQSELFSIENYIFFQADTGVMIDLFPVGKQPEPFIRKLKSGELALNTDEMTVFLNAEKNGTPSQRHAITWSDVPIDIGMVTYRIQFPNMGNVSKYGQSFQIWIKFPNLDNISEYGYESSKYRYKVQTINGAFKYEFMTYI